MRFPLWAAALLLLTSPAFAQNPNAVGLWKTQSPTLSGLYIPSVTPGTSGNYVFQCLPPDLITYFRPQSAGGKRELDFRGVEFKLLTPANPTGSVKNHLIPGWEIRRAVQANAPNEGNLIPYVNPQDATDGLYVYQPAPGSVNVPANSGGLVWAVKLFLPSAVAVPAGSSAGDGLAFRMLDYMKQYGSTATAPNSIMLVMTTNETANANVSSYSGQQLQGQTSVLFFNGTWEFAITYYFNQSMIQPVKNATLLPTGGTLPASIQYPVSMNDGHGAYTTSPGDVISYSGNSNKSLFPTLASSNVWLVPMYMFEGDTVPGFDPAPENWVGNNGVPQLAYIYPIPLQKWLNDLGAIAGYIGPPLGSLLNPNNSTLGLWAGLDLPNFVNFGIAVNSLNFADVSAPAAAGPETQMYDLATNPTGIMVRNFGVFAGFQGEWRSHQTPQRGYTPLTPVGSNIGLGPHPGLPQLVGMALLLQCWVYDVSAPPSINPVGVNIVDVTNTIRIQL